MGHEAPDPGVKIVAPRRFKHWTYLNAEGREIWGHLFPKRMVPVLSMIPKHGPLGRTDSPPVDYYMVYWEELTPLQKHGIVEIILEKLGGSREELEEQIVEKGLPLRRSLTDGSGTNHPGFFL